MRWCSLAAAPEPAPGTSRDELQDPPDTTAVCDPSPRGGGQAPELPEAFGDPVSASLRSDRVDAEPAPLDDLLELVRDRLD